MRSCTVKPFRYSETTLFKPSQRGERPTGKRAGARFAVRFSSLEGTEAPVDFLQRESKLLPTDRPGQAGYHQYGGEESEQRIEEPELKKKDYPAEERKQQNRFDESRIHFI